MKEMAKNWKSILIYLLIPTILIIAIVFFANQQTKVDTKYSEIVAKFENNEVMDFTLDLSSGSLTYKTFADDKKEEKYSVPNVSLFLEDIRDDVNEYNNSHPDNKITYDYKKGTSSTWIYSMLPTILFGLIGAVVLVYFIKKMSSTINNDTNRTLGFGKIRAKTVEDDDSRKTTFDDVAGCDEEKEELEELVDFLKEPERFTQIGARIPKGVLLVGPPGTGKTLLARAVAGEAGVPFLSISGSDFVEMYVGVGASRVRDLFSQAKKKSPSIVFIDEIDAVGRHRGTGLGNSNDEREQTLNQLLVEMDGFGVNEGVIIIAATNRPDVLDPALLRPGRFDRQVAVGTPDTKGREEILKVHSKNKPLAPDVDLKDVAKGTIGWVGADLENLMNEAALLAARGKRKAITRQDIQDALLKVHMGTEKKSHKVSDKEVRLTAYHEAGHAIATHYLETQDSVHEISIIPRGMAGGYTMSLPTEDRSFSSKKIMLDELVVLLGGRVAEAIILGDISTGASNDIERATAVAKEMVTRYGMSDLLGPINYSGGGQEVFIGRDYGHVKDYSEATASKIDDEVSRLINEAYKRTEAILTEHLDKLELVAVSLMERNKLDKDEFLSLIEKGYIEEDDEDDSVVETTEGESVETVEESTSQVEEKETTTQTSSTDDDDFLI